MSLRVEASQEVKAHTGPAYPLANRAKRLLWRAVYVVLFRFSPRPFHAWRSLLLRLFGAKLGVRCHIYPGAVIWAPWNLVCGEAVAIADGAIVYNPSEIELGSFAIISQEAFLCGATHDLRVPGFPLISDSIRVGARAWICARATVQMGVRVGDGAVLGLGGVATRDLEPWTIYAGIPAKKIGERPTFEYLVQS
jgi:putative colanic acid biosynthesis acetyltransferase WcaF